MLSVPSVSVHVRPLSPAVRQDGLPRRGRLLGAALRGPRRLLRPQVADEEHGPAQREHRAAAEAVAGQLRLHHLEGR